MFMFLIYYPLNISVSRWPYSKDNKVETSTSIIVVGVLKIVYTITNVTD
jgi:hypothetical protein